MFAILGVLVMLLMFDMRVVSCMFAMLCRFIVYALVAVFAMIDPFALLGMNDLFVVYVCSLCVRCVMRFLCSVG